MAFAILVYLLLVTEISTQNYDHFVLEAYRDICPYSETCTLPPKQEFPYNREEKIPCCLPCSCAPTCWETGSCCPDALNTSMLNGTYRNTECITSGYPVDDSKYDGYHSKLKRYNTIRTCPSTYHKKNLRLQCTRRHPKTLDELIFVSDEAGNIFRNRYCALCNGVVKFTQWNMLMQCSIQSKTFDRKLTIDFIEQSDCIVWSEAPPSISLLDDNRCYLAYYDKCNITGRWMTYDSNIEKACKSGQYGHHVFFNNLYKNVFCSLCNSEQKPHNDCTAWVRKSTIHYPVTVILDASTLSTANDPTAKCTTGKIYDKYSDQCRDLKCPLNTFPTYGTCSRLFAAIDGIAVEFDVLLTSSDNFSNNSEDISYLLNSTINALNNMIEKQDGHCRVCSNIMRLETPKRGMALVTTISLVLSSSCTEVKLKNVANLLNTRTLFLSLTSANSYIFSLKLILKKNEKHFLDTAFASQTQSFSYSKHICSLPPLHITDLQCPRITISGMDYVNAVRNNYIQSTYQYDKYIADQDNRNLSNITFEICVDEYLSSNGGNSAGQAYCYFFNMRLYRTGLPVFPTLSVFVIILLL